MFTSAYGTPNLARFATVATASRIGPSLISLSSSALSPKFRGRNCCSSPVAKIKLSQEYHRVAAEHESMVEDEDDDDDDDDDADDDDEETSQF